jgi:thymidylate synthase
MSYENFTDAFLNDIYSIIHYGNDVEVRGNKTRELTARLIKIENPRERVICVPVRNNNIFATIAETLWILAGRNDIEFLSKYLPRAKDFSDDGLVWRAGYGKRIRNYHGIDQLKNVIELLRSDPSSRQAVISIFDPTEDFQKSKDIPCTNWLHFMIRDGKLNMTVVVRSNDIMWGASGINWFEWSVLQELVAFNTNTQVGEMNYFADSFHLYERHFKRAETISAIVTGKTSKISFVDMYKIGKTSTVFAIKFEELDYVLGDLFNWENNAGEDLGDIFGVVTTDKFILDCVNMLDIYNHYLRNNINSVKHINSIINSMTPKSDFRLAALEFLSRKEKLNPEIILSLEDMKFLSQFPQENSLSNLQ